jgi:chromosomal replication initiation ATPase DnaA
MTADVARWSPWSRGSDTTNSTFWQPPPALPQGQRWLRVVRAVAHACETHDGAILGRRRDRPQARARQIVYYILREHCQMSLAEIGRLLKRDHTTVLHGCRTVERLMRDGTIEASWIETVARAAGVLD